MKEVPKYLRIWFLIHFIIDILFAIPLIFFPELFLNLMGISVIEPFTARLVGAALIGIGGASFFMHKKGIEVFDSMLNLKLLWSFAAIFGIAWSTWETGLLSGWVILAVFVIFFAVWLYYKIKIND